MLTASLTPLATTLLLAAPLGAEPVDSIARLAPENSFVVVGVDDFPALSDALTESGLGRMWDSPEMKTFFASVMDEVAGDEGFDLLDEWLADTGIELDELPSPAGMVGMAMYLDPDTIDFEAPIPEEPRLDVLIAGDFGDAGEELEETLLRGLEDFDDKGGIELDFEDYRDLTVHVIRIPEPEEPLEDEWGFEVDNSLPFGDGRSFYAVRADGTLLLGSRLETIESAVDALMGDRIACVADTELFQNSMRELSDGHHMHAHLLLTDDLREMIRGSLGAAAMFMLPGEIDFDKLLSTLGLSACQSFCGGVTIDGIDGVMEQEIALRMDERSGLFELIGTPAGAFAPPSFVGAETGGVGLFTFDFPELLPLARRVVEGLPEELRGQAQLGLQQGEQLVAPVLDNLGPKVYVVTSYARPFAEDSQKTLVAIEVKDSLPIANILNTFGIQAGLTPRDFQGSQIFDGGEFSPSIGLGQGYAFIGDTGDVENALRLAGDADAPSLAKQHEFKQAVKPLTNDGVSYMYQSLSRSLEYQYWLMDNMEDMFMMGPDIPTGADVATLLQLADEDAVPPKDFWLRFLGDSVFELEATDTGFRGRSINLRPSVAQ